MIAAVAAGIFAAIVFGVFIVNKLSNPDSAEVAGSQPFGVPAGQSVQTAATVSQGPTITDAECQTFADAMERAVGNKNQYEFQQLLNFEGVIDKAMVGIELSEKDNTGLRRAMSKVIPQWTNQFMTQATAGSYQLLRTRTGQNGVRQALFRLNSDDGINYHRFDLIRNNSNKIVCGDIYIYTTGEYYSTTIRRVMLPIIAHETRSIMDRLSGTENAVVKYLPQMQQMQKAIQRGDGASAIRVFKTLPEELKKAKFVLLLRMNAAPAAGESEYMAAMEDFRKYHPNDLCLDFIGIDYFLLREEYDECYACIDRLDKAVGGDPVLALLRAPILRQQGQYAKARQYMQPLLQDETHAEEAYMELLENFVAEKNHAETARTLSTLTERFGIEWDLRSVPEFGDFVASAEYNTWRSGGSPANSPPAVNQSFSQPPMTGESTTNGAPQKQSAPESKMPSPGIPANPFSGTEGPADLTSDFKFAVMSRNTAKAAAAVAPIQGSDAFVAELKNMVGDMRHPITSKLFRFHSMKSHIEGEVAIAFGIGFGRTSRSSSIRMQSFDQLYLVRINDEWKLCPSLDKPPTDAKYADDVQAMQQWIASQMKDK